MVRFERCRAGVSRHAAIGGLTKASGVALAILLAKIKLARGCRWNRRDIFVERQFGFLPNAGILGVARFAFLLIGLRFLRSRPLRLRQQRRSDERRGGKALVRTVSSRWTPYH